MKDFFKKIFLAALMPLVVISCSSPTGDSDEEDTANLRFFDVVYITQASKITGQSSWTVVQGDQRFKFLQNADESTGTFTVSFANFREPQLASSVCSGGFTGDFSIDSEDDSTVEDEENQVFNPLDPYDPGIDVPDDGDDSEDEVSDILVYVFTLDVPTGSQNRSLTSGCRDVPELFQMKAIRFESGDVLITDLSRNIDYYLVPEIIDTPEE